MKTIILFILLLNCIQTYSQIEIFKCDTCFKKLFILDQNRIKYGAELNDKKLFAPQYDYIAYLNIKTINFDKDFNPLNCFLVLKNNRIYFIDTLGIEIKGLMNDLLKRKRTNKNFLLYFYETTKFCNNVIHIELREHNSYMRQCNFYIDSAGCVLDLYKISDEIRFSKNYNEKYLLFDQFNEQISPNEYDEIIEVFPKNLVDSIDIYYNKLLEFKYLARRNNKFNLINKLGESNDHLFKVFLDLKNNKKSIDSSIDNYPIIKFAGKLKNNKSAYIINTGIYNCGYIDSLGNLLTAIQYANCQQINQSCFTTNAMGFEFYTDTIYPKNKEFFYLNKTKFKKVKIKTKRKFKENFNDAGAAIVKVGLAIIFSPILLIFSLSGTSLGH